MRIERSGSRRSGAAALFALLSVPLLLAVGAAAQEAYDPTDEIATIREQIERNGFSWRAGETSMNRIPPEDRQAWLGLQVPPGESGMLPAESLAGPFTRQELPEVWDWRLHEGVTPVKSQGGCGSCWDFAATAAFESAILICSGIEQDLSEQQVLVCNDDGYGCNGGWMSAAYDVFMHPGAVSEECMPYLADDTVPCTDYLCEIVDVLNAYQDISTDVLSIKESVYMIGPVAVAMTVLGDFYSYQEGCYQSDEPGPINHAVLIVGWDDTACDGEGAWICKNSWGTGWGMDGFFYIKFGSCNIGHSAQRLFYSGVGPIFISHDPLVDTENETDPYEVICEVRTRDFPIDDSKVYLHYDLGDGWNDVQMNRLREGEQAYFRAEIPPQPIGTSIDYWLSAEDTYGNDDTDPTNAPEHTHNFRILRTFFSDDAEGGDPGWSYGVPGDDAVEGHWERGTPEGTWGIGDRPGNPDRDHTPDPGRNCLCTGCEAGNWFWSNDVDGGRTTLMTPAVDLSAIDAATLTYYRWFTNDSYQYPYEDYWEVDVTCDDGESWINLEYTNETLAIWTPFTYELQDYIELTSEVRVRFAASDYTNPSVVEAGVDDIEIVSLQSGSAGLGDEPVVRRIQLTPTPSPFRQSAALRFVLPEPVRGHLRIYTPDGRRVRTLLDGDLPAGGHVAVWDGRDEAGIPVPAGIYLLQLRAGEQETHQRLLRIR